MEPVTNINITNNIEVTNHWEGHEKHVEKAKEIAQKVLETKNKEKDSLNIPIKGYSKKVIKMILLDLLPEVTLKVITKIPFLLRIIL